MNAGRERRTVDEDAPIRSHQQIVFTEINRLHGGVIGDHGEDDVTVGGNVPEPCGGDCPDFLAKLSRHLRADVMHNRYIISLVVEAAGHVSAHAPETDNSYSLVFHSAN